MKKLIYSTSREGYGVDQINRTMTAGELINFLAQYDEDTPIYLSFDNGYACRRASTRSLTLLISVFSSVCPREAFSVASVESSVASVRLSYASVTA